MLLHVLFALADPQEKADAGKRGEGEDENDPVVASLVGDLFGFQALLCFVLGLLIAVRRVRWPFSELLASALGIPHTLS